MANLDEWLLNATVWLRSLNFSYEDLKALVPFLVVLLLLLWLLYRIKARIRSLVKDEILTSFPGIKNTVDQLGNTINLLKLEVERIESRLDELKKKYPK